MELLRLYKQSFSGLSKDVWALALIYLVNRAGEMVIPFMSVFLTNQLGFSKTETGIVLFCYGLGAMCGSNIGGYLTDAIGNFKVMALSLAGSGIAFMCIILFSTFYVLSAWMFLTAVFTSMFSPAAFSAVGIWGIPENKTRGFSLLRMAINLGFSIGPAVGGFIAFKVGYNWLFIIDGLTCFLALITLFLVLRHRNVKQERPKEEHIKHESPYKDIYLMLFLFLNLINMIAFFQILFSVTVYFKEVILLDEMWIGLFFTANGLLVLLLEMPIVYKIEQSKKFFKPLASGAILIGLAYVSLSLFSNPFVAIFFYSIFLAVGEVVNFPLIPSLAIRRADEQNHGKYMGMVSMMFAVAYVLAPILGLPIVERIGYHTYFYAAATLSMIAGICLWFLKPYFQDSEMNISNKP